MDIPQIRNLLRSTIDFRRFLDEIPIGIVVLDTQRRVVLLNNAMEALSGFTRNESSGLSCYHVIRSRLCIQNCPLVNFKSGGEAVCVESDMINRDRQLIPVRTSFAPILDENDAPVGFIETLEDLRLLKELDQKVSHAYSFGHIIGKSAKMEKIFNMLPMVAQSDSSVLITGETGTGKDMAAEAIHHASDRAKGPFIKINCGALPETLLESELFGHQKGAFTGAFENKPGRFHLAHNGTLYLTEIGDLPISLQVKLLTFLDDKIVYPLGSTKGFQADVRIIAATHRNLEKMVNEDHFRKDLLFRLNVVRVYLPPLRERGDDVRLLLDHFVNTFATQFSRTIRGFSDRALTVLLNYHYPGNVRELRNIVEYAVNICREETIRFHHLPAYLTDTDSGLLDTTPVGATGLFRTPLPDSQGIGVRTDWPAVEQGMILDALVKARGRKNEAAKYLGWARTTLWRKMKKYNITNK
ncbi:MAG: sigma 54-interacting transcriptional regulator [Desulfobacteraceae bacterium]|nr:sigma 54-interacting transcriptional regulator [Desulfobacteraceae bacterium]